MNVKEVECKVVVCIRLPGAGLSASVVTTATKFTIPLRHGISRSSELLIAVYKT
jgi:hypothetical protein